jgi:hypothetical protein
MTPQRVRSSGALIFDNRIRNYRMTSKSYTRTWAARKGDHVEYFTRRIDAEQWSADNCRDEQVDLYRWTGQAWAWLGCELTVICSPQEAA